MKPAQKLKGARLEAGQTQERDDASLLAHREESKDAVKSRRAFLRFVLVTVYLVVWGVSVLAFWMGGRTDAMGYSLVVFYAVLPMSTLVLSSSDAHRMEDVACSLHALAADSVLRRLL